MSEDAAAGSDALAVVKVDVAAADEPSLSSDPPSDDAQV